MLRQIILDTETTGLDPREGHKVIEIGCVEMLDRSLSGNNFHYYLQPDRLIDPEAIAVHGISNEFLVDKPRFADIATEFMVYIEGAELIIHNAPFDIAFLNHELAALKTGFSPVDQVCKIIDTLVMARQMFPGQRNSLDALCKRYSIDNGHRTLHGALLDSEILADVYLAMTGGQVNLWLSANSIEDGGEESYNTERRSLPEASRTLGVIRANAIELAAHAERLAAIEKSAGRCLWQ